jgi:diaminopimelate epimerase
MGKPAGQIDAKSQSQIIEFAKYDACGNSFVLVERTDHSGVTTGQAAQMFCAYRNGIGADGLVISTPLTRSSTIASIWNADGTQASMCGNGLRVAALHSIRRGEVRDVEIRFGKRTILAREKDGGVAVRLPVPAVRAAAHSALGLRWYDVYSGVEHAVCIMASLDDCDVAALGALIRNSSYYAPTGTNVNFMTVLGNDAIAVRTYEKGVERETGSCGSGALSTATVACNLRLLRAETIKVHNRSGGVLTVHFDGPITKPGQAWVSGPCHLQFRGEYVLRP